MVGLSLIIGCGSEGPGSQQPVLKTGTFSFPSLASAMLSIVREKQFDDAHGFRLEVQEYGNVAAYYAGLATGEVDTIAGGPHVSLRMRQQGVPIKATNTFATLASLVVLASDPGVSNLLDLRGKSLAADLSSSEYHILRLVARSQGLNLDNEVRVVQASPSVARAHLQSGEVAAILTFEPLASLALTQDPSYHPVFTAAQGWGALTEETGWLLITLVREDWLKRHPGGAQLWMAALQDAALFLREDPAASDAIVSDALRIPPGVFLKAMREGRIGFQIEPASQQRDSLLEMFRLTRSEDGGAISDSGLIAMESF